MYIPWLVIMKTLRQTNDWTLVAEASQNCLVAGAKKFLKCKKYRGDHMRATILRKAIILTKVHRAVVCMMAKGCIVA